MRKHLQNMECWKPFSMSNLINQKNMFIHITQKVTNLVNRETNQHLELFQDSPAKIPINELTLICKWQKVEKCCLLVSSRIYWL